MWWVLREGDIIDDFWSFTNREGGRGWCVGMISLLEKKVEVCRIHRIGSGPLKLVWQDLPFDEKLLTIHNFYSSDSRKTKANTHQDGLKLQSEADTKTNQLEKIQSYGSIVGFPLWWVSYVHSVTTGVLLAPHQTTHHVGIMYSSSPGQGKSVVFMGQISLVRYGKYRHQFHLHLHLRSFLASNFLFDLLSQQFGTQWCNGK